MKEALDKNLVMKLAERIGINLREAMDIYYRSKLASQINNGSYGIQYLDVNYLADDLIINEPDLLN